MGEWMPRMGSLFSGYGGFDKLARDAGFRIAFQVEIEPACNHILRRHFLDVPRFTDVRNFDGKPYQGTIDLLCAGFPCQDLSVAGKGAGLDGTRSGLFFEVIRLIKEIAPKIFLLENVPGLLSNDKGRSMATVVRELAQLGDYYTAWRSLDLQYFGCPQRRERVFFVGCLGDRTRAEKILFESESLQRNPEKGRKAGKEVAGSIGCCTKGGWEQDLDRSGAYVPEIVGTIAANCGPGGHSAGNFQCNQAVDAGHILKSEGFDGLEDGTGRGTPIVPVSFQSKASSTQSMNPSEVCPTIDKSKGEGLVIAFITNQTGAQGPIHSEYVTRTLSQDHPPAIAFTERTRAEGRTFEYQEDLAHSRRIATASMQVRRLTPRECERLQGLPDDWTKYGLNEKWQEVQLNDSARYKMIGNGVGLPVVDWIMQAIKKADREGEI